MEASRIQKICTLLLVMGTWTIVLTEGTIFYSCPEVDSDTAGICEEDCTSHSDCPDETRCCSNGCGHACATPTTIPYHAPTLVCPEAEEEIAGICSEECAADDNDCEDDGELCCSNGCGHVCTEGVSPTPVCSTLRDDVLNSSLVGAFVPQCQEDGTFSSVQCHASTGYCWCVGEESGQPSSDMIRFRQPQCNCTYNGQVFVVGETFTPAEGCGNCYCTVEGQVQCDREDCPEDTGTGAGQKTYFSCPAIRTGASTDCNADCLLHSECPDALNCCYNGCGYSCVQSHQIPFIDISSSSSSVEECPDASDVPCVRAMGSCREEEYRCEEGYTCCDNDCASAVCIVSGGLNSPCRRAVEIASSANSSSFGWYRPQCTSEGIFREIQCHAHFCWCVASDSGVPVSDIVAFEQADVLQCAACEYNGVKYRHLESFPSGVDCNTCTCIGGTISCTGVTGVECADEDDEDESELWEWWHTLLIGCVVVVVVLVSIVLALLVGIVIMMRQNGPHRHQRLKETTSDECEMVEYHSECVELKVPIEDNLVVGTTKA